MNNDGSETQNLSIGVADSILQQLKNERCRLLGPATRGILPCLQLQVERNISITSYFK